MKWTSATKRIIEWLLARSTNNMLKVKGTNGRETDQTSLYGNERKIPIVAALRCSYGDDVCFSIVLEDVNK
jgi:hypothetical protein